MYVQIAQILYRIEAFPFIRKAPSPVLAEKGGDAGLWKMSQVLDIFHSPPRVQLAAVMCAKQLSATAPGLPQPPAAQLDPQSG
jgi:hypothetical protein